MYIEKSNKWDYWWYPVVMVYSECWKGTPISRSILKEKALIINNKIENGGEFSTSEKLDGLFIARNGTEFLWSNACDENCQLIRLQQVNF